MSGYFSFLFSWYPLGLGKSDGSNGQKQSYVASIDESHSLNTSQLSSQTEMEERKSNSDDYVSLQQWSASGSTVNQKSIARAMSYWSNTTRYISY